MSWLSCIKVNLFPISLRFWLGETSPVVLTARLSEARRHKYKLISMMQASDAGPFDLTWTISFSSTWFLPTAIAILLDGHYRGLAVVDNEPLQLFCFFFKYPHVLTRRADRNYSHPKLTPLVKMHAMGVFGCQTSKPIYLQPFYGFN